MLELATDQFVIEPTDIFVLIGPGTYARERIDWTLAHDDFTVTFAAKDPHDRPVFDGEGLTNLFFSYHNQPDVTSTNFIFDGLVMKNYAVAIQLGYRSSGGVNSNNIVQNCLFQNLGERFSVGPAIAAIGRVRQQRLSDACADAGKFENHSYGNSIYWNRYKSVGNLFEETPRTSTGGHTDVPSCVTNDSCKTPPTDVRTTIRQNVDVTEGTCFFRILGEDCDRMDRFAYTLHVDYNDELAHRSAAQCGLRKKSWEASCTQDSPEVDLQVEMIFMTNP